MFSIPLHLLATNEVERHKSSKFVINNYFFPKISVLGTESSIVLDITRQFQNLLTSLSLVKTELVLPLKSRAWLLASGWISCLSVWPTLNNILKDIFPSHLVSKELVEFFQVVICQHLSSQQPRYCGLTLASTVFLNNLARGTGSYKLPCWTHPYKDADTVTWAFIHLFV